MNHNKALQVHSLYETEMWQRRINQENLPNNQMTPSRKQSYSSSNQAKMISPKRKISQIAKLETDYLPSDDSDYEQPVMSSSNLLNHSSLAQTNNTASSCGISTSYPTAARKKNRSKDRLALEQDDGSTSATSTVVFNFQDVCKITKELDQKKQKNTELKEKNLKMKKKLSILEKDCFELQSNNQDITNSNQLLQQELDSYKSQTSQLEALLAQERQKNAILSNVFPSNFLYNLSMCVKLRKQELDMSKLSREYTEQEQKLEQLCVQKDEAIHGLNNQLKLSRETLGALYSQKTEIETNFTRVCAEEEAKISELEKLNEALTNKLGSNDSLCQQLNEQIEQLKYRYFFACALALKLSLQIQGQNINIDIHSLFDDIQSQKIPFNKWEMVLSQILCQGKK